jgi:hypothetical protein
VTRWLVVVPQLFQLNEVKGCVKSKGATRWLCGPVRGTYTEGSETGILLGRLNYIVTRDARSDCSNVNPFKNLE